MTVDALPQRDELGTGEGPWSHVACRCEPDTALCGADLTGLEWADGPIAEPEVCPMCTAVLDVSPTCGRCGR